MCDLKEYVAKLHTRSNDDLLSELESIIRNGAAHHYIRLVWVRSELLSRLDANKQHVDVGEI